MRGKCEGWRVGAAAAGCSTPGGVGEGECAVTCAARTRRQWRWPLDRRSVDASRWCGEETERPQQREKTVAYVSSGLVYFRDGKPWHRACAPAFPTVCPLFVDPPFQ